MRGGSNMCSCHVINENSNRSQEALDNLIKDLIENTDLEENLGYAAEDLIREFQSLFPKFLKILGGLK